MSISLRDLAPVVWMLSVYVCVFMMCFFFLGLDLLPAEIAWRKRRLRLRRSTDLGRGSCRRFINDDVRWCVLGGLNLSDHELGRGVRRCRWLCGQRRQEFLRGKNGEWFGLCAVGGGLDTCGLRVTPSWGGSCGLVGVYLSAGFWIGYVHLCLQLTDTLFLLPRGTLRR